MIGPAIAGMVSASVGAGWAFLLNGASFGASALQLQLRLWMLLIQRVRIAVNSSFCSTAAKHANSSSYVLFLLLSEQENSPVVG